MEFVQVKGDIPLALKRRVFAALALQGVPFSRWLQVQMEEWLAGVAVESAVELSKGARDGEVCRV